MVSAIDLEALMVSAVSSGEAVVADEPFGAVAVPEELLARFTGHYDVEYALLDDWGAKLDQWSVQNHSTLLGDLFAKLSQAVEKLLINAFPRCSCRATTRLFSSFAFWRFQKAWCTFSFE